VRTSLRRACYGFPVEIAAHPDAVGVVDAFFGPQTGADAAAPTVTLVVDVAEEPPGVTVEPPHTLEVIAADPIVVDAGSSRATVEPAGWRVHLTLGRGDLDDDIVWGRWLLERIFLYLVCRSPRHYPLHAGALVVDGRVALVSAATGVGKSTFTYWALRSGAELAGEDIMVRHVDGAGGALWGYPRAVYLSPEWIARCPELAGTVQVEVPGKGKSRIRIPDALAGRLRPGVHPDCVVFLSRDGEPGARRLDVAEAVERCRDDIGTAKTDPGLLAEVERDLEKYLGDLPIWELTLADDLDAGYAELRDLVRRG
jgi:hypothetical protein